MNFQIKCNNKNSFYLNRNIIQERMEVLAYPGQFLFKCLESVYIKIKGEEIPHLFLLKNFLFYVIINKRRKDET